MKFSCNKSDLDHHLSLVSRVVPNRPTHPILGNILITAKDNHLELTAFDLAISIKSSLPVMVLEEGSITLPSKLFCDIVSRAPNATLEIDSREDENETIVAKIISPSGHSEIRGLLADEYPSLPEITLEKGEKPHQISVAALINGLQRTLFAVSDDETKQVLTGVHIKSSSDAIEFAATDGHRLSIVTVKPEENSCQSDFKLTLPGKALRELEKGLSTQKQKMITLKTDDTQAIFQTESQQLTTRILDGAYPNYDQLIPKSFARTAEIDRKRLLAALDRVSVLSSKHNLVKMQGKGNNEMLISVEVPDMGSADERILATLTGEPIEMGFNIHYLMDGIKTLQCDSIIMKYNESNQPVIFTPVNDPSDIYLVMPIQIVR